MWSEVTRLLLAPRSRAIVFSRRFFARDALSAFPTRALAKYQDHEANSRDNAERQEYKRGQEVSIFVKRIDKIGVFVSVNDNEAHGLVNRTEYDLMKKVTEIREGDALTGYVARVNPDGKLDITLRNVGRDSFFSLKKLIVSELLKNSGSLPIGDRSSVSEVRNIFPGVSKSDFKRAIGSLFEIGMVIPSRSSVGLAMDPQLIPKAYLTDASDVSVPPLVESFKDKNVIILDNIHLGMSEEDVVDLVSSLLDSQVILSTSITQSRNQKSLRARIHLTNEESAKKLVYALYNRQQAVKNPEARFQDTPLDGIKSFFVNSVLQREWQEILDQAKTLKATTIEDVVSLTSSSSSTTGVRSMDIRINGNGNLRRSFGGKIKVDEEGTVLVASAKDNVSKTMKNSRNEKRGDQQTSMMKKKEANKQHPLKTLKDQPIIKREKKINEVNEKNIKMDRPSTSRGDVKRRPNIDEPDRVYSENSLEEEIDWKTDRKVKKKTVDILDGEFGGGFM